MRNKGLVGEDIQVASQYRSGQQTRAAVLSESAPILACAPGGNLDIG
jgi:hypothetical protein